MANKNLKKFILLSTFCFAATNTCLADITSIDLTSQPSSSAQTMDLEKKVTQQSFTPKTEMFIDLQRLHGSASAINLSGSDTFFNLTEATDRFVQCNIKAAWEDFKNLINNVSDNDFVYMSFANQMADLGLFDLASLSSGKIKDKDISNVSMDAMRRFYYPKRKLKLEDELSLAEAYSNILYNNQSSEAVNEVLKNQNLLSVSDYANYIVALGSYKSSFYPRASKYINIAIIQNPSNLNYLRLKAQILADDDKPEEAIKTVETLKRQNLNSFEYERKIKSLEQLVLYKISKSEGDKNYHLGYYYYLENDPSKAIRTLQSALGGKRKISSGTILGLMSEIYFSMNEFEKAADTAKKAHKINSNNPKALVTLGDLNYRDKNYKVALNYYKKAEGQDKKSYIPMVKTAQTYQKLSNVKKAQEIYTKVLKTHSDSAEAYYNVAMLSGSDKEKQTIYLKKALAVNPLYKDAWIELAKSNIDKGNYDIAQTYLANAYYIDENDFRYYYYQGLVNENTGDFVQAKFNYRKCLKLNQNFTDAQKALDSVINKELNNTQDNI